jgi:hypothetical protein
MDKKEQKLAARRAREKKARDELSDSYVRKLLLGKEPTDLEKSDFPDDLVKAKRMIVALQRFIHGKESADPAIEAIERLDPHLKPIRPRHKAKVKADN